MEHPVWSVPIRDAGWRTLALAVALGVVACGGGEPAEERPAEAEVRPAAAAVAEPAPEQATPSRRWLPDEMRRSTRAENFPHGAHVEIVCSVCHAAPRGHTVHAGLSCAECHRASALATRRSLTPDECMACHHSPQRNLPCSSCHTAPGPRTTARQIQLGVWAAPRTRSLPFDHALHADVTCATCHQQRPSMAPTRACGSCHEDHHRPDARCLSCHAEPPASAHDVNVHLGCAGARCHDAPDVEAMSQRRSVCLVCHQAQEQHEPGRECAECHQVR